MNANRCPVCKRLTTEAWVKQLNKLATAMDEDSHMMHPHLAWHEAQEADRNRFKRLALTPTCECEAVL